MRQGQSVPLCLQEAGEEIGERKAQHILEYAPLGEPVLHVVSSLRSIIFNYSMGLVRFSRVSFCLRRGIKHKPGAPKTALLVFYPQAVELFFFCGGLLDSGDRNRQIVQLLLIRPTRPAARGTPKRILLPRRK